MSLVLALPVALFPSILWLLVMRWWDRREPEPPRLLARLFVAGVLGAVVIGILRLLLQVVLVSGGFLPPLAALSLDDGLVPLLFGALAIAAIQEVVKFAITERLVRHERAFSHAVDGIIYATTVAWGVALVENVLVLLRSLPLLHGFDGPAISSLTYQLLFTTLMLGVASGYAGLALGQVRLRRSTSRMSAMMVIARGLFEAIFLHTTFRVLILLEQPTLAGVMTLLAAVYLFSRFAVVDVNVQAQARRWGTRDLM